MKALGAVSMMVGNERAALPWSFESGKGGAKPGMLRGPAGTMACRDSPRNAGQSLVSFETHVSILQMPFWLPSFFFLFYKASLWDKPYYK